MTVLDEPSPPSGASPPRPGRRPGPAAPRVGMRRRPAWRRLGRWSLRVGVILAIGIPALVVTTGVSGGWLLLFGDLPGTVPEEKPPVVAQPSKVYDAYGAEIGEFHEGRALLCVLRDDDAAHHSSHLLTVVAAENPSRVLFRSRGAATRN